MVMQMLGSFAEFERSMVRERTRAGLAAARDRGARLGLARPN
jgi:DNA invertase Pin-like site-specific DNA recombinase